MAGAIRSMLSPDEGDGSRRWRSRIAVLGRYGGAVALLAVAASLVVFVSGARADGDPASDYLVSRQVFVSSQQGVESSGQRELLATVGAANRAGFAIRVAIISSDYDLGSITALWRKPALYARFLGLGLASAYRGRLLVVMPNGFGFNWPGHPAGREQQVLAKVATGSGRPACCVRRRRRSADLPLLTASPSDRRQPRRRVPRAIEAGAACRS